MQVPDICVAPPRHFSSVYLLTFFLHLLNDWHILTRHLLTLSFSPFFFLSISSLASTQRACAGSNYSNSISPPACQQIISALKIILGEDGTDIGTHACLLSFIPAFKICFNAYILVLAFSSWLPSPWLLLIAAVWFVHLSAHFTHFFASLRPLPPHSQVSARFCSFATMPITFAGVWKRWVFTSSARTIRRSCQSCTPKVFFQLFGCGPLFTVPFPHQESRRLVLSLLQVAPCVQGCRLLTRMFQTRTCHRRCRVRIPLIFFLL